MKKNGIAILALLLALLSIAGTAAVWLSTSETMASQKAELDRLRREMEALEDRLAQSAGKASLELAHYELSARAWADGTGADVTVTAVPKGYEEDLEVVFFAGNGTNGEESLCSWDGSAYVGAVSLSAANGYEFALVTGDTWITLASAEGDVALDCVYLADSLESYGEFEVQSWSAEADTLTIHRGFGMALLPRFDQSGAEVTAEDCALVLKLGEQVLSAQPIRPGAGEAAGSLEFLAEELTFDLPELEEEEQVELWLELELSNGGMLTTLVSGWTVSSGQLGQVAG